MANNSSTPYFTRFADLEVVQSSLQLEFLCLYPTKPAMVQEMESKGFKCHWVYYNRENRKIQLILAFFRCLTLLRKIKVDVVHTHLFEDSLPVLLAGWLLGIKKRVISKLDAGYHWDKILSTWSEVICVVTVRNLPSHLHARRSTSRCRPEVDSHSLRSQYLLIPISTK